MYTIEKLTFHKQNHKRSSSCAYFDSINHINSVNKKIYLKEKNYD